MTAEAPQLPIGRNPPIPLLSTVSTGSETGVVVARSFTTPIQYDVRLANGEVLRHVIAIQLLSPYDGPPLERVR